jgi:hypothetical protein
MIIPYQDALTKVEISSSNVIVKDEPKSVIQCTTLSTSEKLKTLIVQRLKKYCSINTGIKTRACSKQAD